MLTFYHAPWSRSSGILWLLEELGQPYELEIVDIRAEGGVPESYRTIQPNKKVPAISHDGTIVTERATPFRKPAWRPLSATRRALRISPGWFIAIQCSTRRWRCGRTV